MHRGQCAWFADDNIIVVVLEADKTVGGTISSFSTKITTKRLH
jgi:hypothetical protein